MKKMVSKQNQSSEKSNWIFGKPMLAGIFLFCLTIMLSGCIGSGTGSSGGGESPGGGLLGPSGGDIGGGDISGGDIGGDIGGASEPNSPTEPGPIREGGGTDVGTMGSMRANINLMSYVEINLEIDKIETIAPPNPILLQTESGVLSGGEFPFDGYDYLNRISYTIDGETEEKFTIYYKAMNTGNCTTMTPCFAISYRDPEGREFGAGYIQKNPDSEMHIKENGDASIVLVGQILHPVELVENDDGIFEPMVNLDGEEIKIDFELNNFNLFGDTEEITAAFIPTFPLWHNGNWGNSISIYGDFIAVGAHNHTNKVNNLNPLTQAGAVFIYRKTPDHEVTQIQLIHSPEGANNNFGRSIALWGDRLFVGAPRNKNDDGDPSGAVFVFKFDSVQNKFLPDPETPKIVRYTIDLNRSGAFVLSRRKGLEFGYSLDVNGNDLIIGSPARISNPNAINQFSESMASIYLMDDSVDWDKKPVNIVPCLSAGGNGAYNGHEKFAEEDSSSLQERFACKIATQFSFGLSVAIADDLAIVGAPTAEIPNVTHFRAYSTGFNKIEWKQTGYFPPTNPFSPNILVGLQVDTHNGRFAFSDPYDSQKFTKSGATFVTGSTLYDDFEHAVQLRPTDGKENDLFGYSIKLGDGVFAVSATNADDRAINSGAVYVYKRQGSFFTETKLVPAEINEFSRMGRAMALDPVDGDTLVFTSVFDRKKAYNKDDPCNTDGTCNAGHNAIYLHKINDESSGGD